MGIESKLEAPMSQEKTKVVFRVWPGGDVLALFPEEPGDCDGRFCSSYMHVGQHSSADYTGCIQATRPAQPVEYADLAKELERIGYVLDIRKRAGRNSRDAMLSKLRG
jgi:hypothetical protein